MVKKVVGMKSRCVRKGIRKLPKSVKRLYEIRNTLRKRLRPRGTKSCLK
jgi:hypothetical protein